MNPTQTTMDQGAVNVAKAIRQTESSGNFNAKGASGEYGAYQWTAPTWNAHAQNVLGYVPKFGSSEMTPELQNAVAYGTIKQLKDSGKNVAQIAATWNSGSDTNWENKIGVNSSGVKYNVPQYVKSVTDAYQTIKNGGQVMADPNNPSSVASTDNQAPSVGGFVQNIFSSGANFVGGLANAVMHPVDTVSNLASTVAGGVEKGYGALTGQAIDTPDTQNFGNLVSYFGQRYGGSNAGEIAQNIIKTAYKDPVGVALDLSTLIDGVGAGVGAAGKIASVSKLAETGANISRVGEAINPIVQSGKAAGAVAKPIISGVESLTKSALSHATGFNPETISNIVRDPAAFSKTAMDEVSRGGVLQDVTDGLNTLQKSYSESGKAYTDIAGRAGRVALPENFLSDVLNKGTATAEGKAIPLGYKLTQEADGTLKVSADTNTKFYDARSVTGIQNFVDRWGGKTDLTPKEFLNMRQEAAKLGKLGREMGENKGAALIGRQIQGELNKAVRPQIEGLKALDESSAPQIQLISKVKKDLFNADGSLKDNAASKVANALNKDNLMQRLEQVSPGITHKLEILKSVEDIERSMGIKVGNYARSAGEIFSVGTGNIPMLVGMIMTHPTVATQLLKGFGYVGKAAEPILGRVRAMIGALPKDIVRPIGSAGVINNQAISQQK